MLLTRGIQRRVKGYTETKTPMLTFQVTANLERDTAVDIEVFDGRTGVRLGGAEATVSAKIVVEDDLA